MNSLHNIERYVSLPKNELINLCLSSLVNSVNKSRHDIELTVLDDHSAKSDKEKFLKILKKCEKRTSFIELNDTGPSASCRLTYELIEKKATDLWYHVEDDYLHFENSIEEMINAINHFEKITKKNIAIFPYDCMCRYYYQIYPSYILHGPSSHYRTINHSTYTCMTSRAVYDKYKEYFELAAEYVCKKSEDETINKVWQQPDVLLLNPIPSLAMHIVDKDGKDPYIDIEKLIKETPKFLEHL